MTNNTAYSGSVYAAKRLIKRERIIGSVWEVARQDQGITDVLLRAGSCSIFHTSMRFMEYDDHFDNIITEPQPADTLAWAQRAMDVANHVVAFLLPLAKTIVAKELFEKTPPARIYVLSKHLPLRRGVYAWFVWQKGYIEPPVIRWI